MLGDKTTGRVRVRTAVRIRPLLAGKGKKTILSQNGRNVQLESPNGGSKTYSFDYAFGPRDGQAEVYEKLGNPAIKEVLSGFNSTIFSYGQTNSGKTYSIIGGDDDQNLGMLPRAIKNLFQGIEGIDAALRISALEVYNEELCDLLVDGSTVPLRIFETADGVQVKDLHEVLCHDESDAAAAFKRAYKGRRVAATHSNQHSSRSHAIFQIKVVTRSIADDGRELVTNGCLNLVDLAGSECVGKSGARDQRLREAGQINQSLLTLGRVITALTNAGSQHVPYRESKLTRLLQDSLGGKTLTTILACVSPSSDAVDETSSTLQYASQARAIYNTPQAHTRLQGTAVLKDISQEVEDLKALLRAQREKNGVMMVPNEKYEQMVSSLQKNEEEIYSLNAELIQTKEELETTRSELIAEEARHAASRAYEKALIENEKKLVDDGKTLSISMNDAVGELEVAMKLLECRALSMKKDTQDALALTLKAKEVSENVDDEINDHVTSLFNQLSSISNKRLDEASNVALAAAEKLTRLGLTMAKHFKAKIETDGLTDIKQAETHASRVTAISEKAQASSLNAAANIDDIQNQINDKTTSLSTRLHSAQETVKKSITANHIRTTKAKSEVTSSLQYIEEETNAAIDESAAAIKLREETLECERANFFALCKSQREWLESVQCQLRQAVDMHFEARMREIESLKTTTIASNAESSATLIAEDRSRVQRLTTLKNNVLPNTLADSLNQITNLSDASVADLTTAAADLPGITSDVKALAHESEVASVSVSTKLHSTAAELKLSGDTLAKSLRELSMKYADERNGYTSDIISNIENESNEANQKLQTALKKASDTLEDNTKGLQKKIEVSSQAIKTTVSSIAETSHVLSDTLAARDTTTPDVGLSNYREVAQNVNFKAIPTREALVADHYASVAATAGSIEKKSFSAPTMMPLADASNR